MTDAKSDIEAKLGLGAHRRRRGLWPAFAMLALLAAAALAYLGLARTTVDAPAFRTEAVRRGDLVVTVSATGSVEPTEVVDISSELSGTLTQVLVDYNDRVSRGQVLARLNTVDLEAQVAVRRASLRAAEAMVSRAATTLSEAETAHDTARRLDERGATSHQALLSAIAALERARADLAVAEADRDLAAANLGLAEAELAKACICAPIDGVVLDRQAEAGQIVAASLSAPTLFTVAGDLARMELQVAVDEADIGRLSTGNRATFTVDAFDDRTFPATITRIRYAPETVDGVVTYLATLDVDNSDLLLRPGMTATAEIVVNEVDGALLVPNAALRYRPPVTAPVEEETRSGGLLGLIMPDRPQDSRAPGSMGTVWVLRDGAAMEIAITPGDSDGRHTEVLGGELSEGDLVITGDAGP